MSETPARLIVPPDFLHDPALAAVLAALPEARVVGGAVRDALAGLAVADVDLATPRTPDEVTAALRAAKLKAVPTGIDHGTITAVSGHRGFEVTTLRHDVETDGRHAVVRYAADWREDAARRDFTINAMSMTPDGAVFDYFDGLDDLAAGRVRFVGDPATRIAEDYLRTLRYFRFLARYGNGTSDEATERALAHSTPGLARLSPERVWSEIKRILTVPDPDAALADMARLGVLAAVLPDSHLLPLAGLPDDPMLRLAALKAGTADALAVRFKMSNAERERLASLAGDALADDAADADIRRALADTPTQALTGRAWLARRSAELIARIEGVEVPTFPLKGRDLRALGVPPGEAIGTILAELRHRWLDSGCVMTEAELRAELARRLAP